MSSSEYKTLSDPELISLCLKGDSQAWEFLILRYRRLIYSIPRKFRFSPVDSADVFQAVCLLLIENLGGLRDEAKIASWLIKITVRQCMKVRDQSYWESNTREYEEPLDPANTVEEIRMQSQHQQQIRDIVASLPERCRKLMEMLYFDTKIHSYESIAQTLKMPVASVGPNRARCLERLRGMFQQRGIG